MRLMSYVRLRAKTGRYEYRRVVPPHLRALVPQVAGFGDKPGRTEFTQSLDAASKPEANRIGAALDQRVQAALDVAEARAAKRVSWGETDKGAQVALDPASVFGAIEAWKRQEVKASELGAFNGLLHQAVGDDLLGQPDFRYNLQQFSQYPIGNEGALAALRGFDEALLAALGTQGIVVGDAHPVIEKLRPAFAKAWWEVVVAKGSMADRRWDYAPGTETTEPPLVRTAPPAAAYTTRSGETGTPFLTLLESWKEQAGIRQRQLAAYATDIIAFAAFHPAITVEAVRRTHAQKWVVSLTGQSPKTLQRKLAALRTYWRFVKASALLEDDERQPFHGLVIPKAKVGDLNRVGKKKRLEFTAEQVASLWKAARDRGDTELADVIRLGAFTGARIESLFKLQVNDMRVEPKTNIEYLHFSDKTEAGNRDVPIHPAVFSLLISRKEAASVNGFLLPSTAKNQYGERSVPCAKRFSRLKTALGFGETHTYHSLRKTVATLLEEGGEVEAVAADILGDKIKSMTLGVYRGTTSLTRKIAAIRKGLTYPSLEFMKE